MRTKRRWLLAAGLLAVPVVVMVAGGQQPPAKPPEGVPAPAEEKEREADREAIRQASQEFARAFEKGDAKAAAACWTEGGEYVANDGEVVRGRAAIEKLFAAMFKDTTPGKIEVDIRSVRFPSRDSAVEEGFLRHTPDGPGLPGSSMYSALHVREDGRWKVAVSREWGAGQDRLGDLAWLIGRWEGGPKGQEVSLTFERDGTAQFILGRFAKTIDGKPASAGSMKIGLDGQRGQLRSWHFDDDGGQGQCLWIRDGNRWVLDAIGTLADGTETEAVNVLARLGADEITWRSIDRVAGGEPLPDTVPLKLTRVRSGK